MNRLIQHETQYKCPNCKHLIPLSNADFIKGLQWCHALIAEEMLLLSKKLCYNNRKLITWVEGRVVVHLVKSSDIYFKSLPILLDSKDLITGFFCP